MIRDLETLLSIRWLSIKFLTFFFLSLTELMSYTQISPFLSFPCILFFGWISMYKLSCHGYLKILHAIGGIDLWMT